jgi:hypothetical protein
MTKKGEKRGREKKKKKGGKRKGRKGLRQWRLWSPKPMLLNHLCSQGGMERTGLDRVTSGAQSGVAICF